MRTNSSRDIGWSAWFDRRCSPMVEKVSLDMLRPQSEPAP
jgi:hypothetical protein